MILKHRAAWVFAFAACAAWGDTVKLRIADGAARVRLRKADGTLRPLKLPGAVMAHPRFPELGAVVERRAEIEFANPYTRMQTCGVLRSATLADRCTTA